MFRKTSPICQCHLHSWKKCWKVHIRVLSLSIPPWIVNSKKIQKNMVEKNDKCSNCLPSFIRKRLSWKSWQKKSILVCWLFFRRDTHECYSPMKLGTHFKHLSFFTTNFFWIFWTFLDFTIHGGSIRAKTRMGTFQHFFMNANDTHI